MTEVWKPIIGYEGSYEISNLGKAKSLKNGRVKILKPRLDDRGYPMAGLYNGEMKNHKIHTLVWDHFGDKPRNGHKLQVDHIDGNKNNSRIDNLQLLTSRANSTKRSIQNGTKYPTGVYYNKQKKKFQAQIRINGKTKSLGRYLTIDEASSAYQKAVDNLQ